MPTNQKWKVLGSQLVFDSPWLRVFRDSCRLPNGIVVPDFYYSEDQDFVRVFALTVDAQLVLVRQYRHPIGECLLELPAGIIGQADSDPVGAAKRELREETGYEAEAWQYMRSLPVSPGKSKTRAHAVLATGARITSAQQLDSSEDLQVVLVPVAELHDQIAGGEIVDATSLATCILAMKELEQKQK